MTGSLEVVLGFSVCVQLSQWGTIVRRAIDSSYRQPADPSDSASFSARCAAGSTDLPVPYGEPTNSTGPLNRTETANLLSKLPRGIRSAEFGTRSGATPNDERIGHIAKTSPPKLPELRSLISANSTSAQRTLYSECPIDSTATLWAYTSAANPTLDASYLGGRDIQFYALDQARTGGVKTGVIFVTTFDPQPATGTCFNRYILDIVIGLQNFTREGVQRVLVDTSVSSGSRFCKSVP